MKHTNKILLGLLAAAVMSVSLVACDGEGANRTIAVEQTSDEKSTEPSQTSVHNTSTDDQILKAWTGEFSEEKLKLAINEYQSNYTNIVLEKGAVSTVSFETDFDAASCSVVRLSRIDDTDIEVELNGYVDTFVDTKCDGRTITIPIDWWYTENDSWANDFSVWSYLVCVKEVTGNSHYYYFRIDYSAYAQS